MIAGSIASLSWSILTPVRSVEVSVTQSPTSKKIPEIPETQLADLNRLAAKRLQGVPVRPEQESNVVRQPPVLLPTNVELEAILFGGESSSVATFSISGADRVSRIVGEEVGQIKILSIEKDKVKVEYQDSQFEMGIGKEPLKIGNSK